MPSDLRTWPIVTAKPTTTSSGSRPTQPTPRTTRERIPSDDDDDDDDEDDDDDDDEPSTNHHQHHHHHVPTDTLEQLVKEEKPVVADADDDSHTCEPLEVFSEHEQLRREYARTLVEHETVICQLNELHRSELARVRADRHALSERQRSSLDAEMSSRIGAFGVLRAELVQVRRELSAAHAAAELAEARADDYRRSLNSAQATLTSARADVQLAQAIANEQRARCDAAEARIRLAEERAQIEEAASAALSVRLAAERQECAKTIALVRQQTAELLRRAADEHAQQLEKERAHISLLQKQLNDAISDANAIDSSKKRNAAAMAPDEPAMKRATTAAPAAAAAAAPAAAAAAAPKMVVMITGFTRNPPDNRQRCIDALKRFGVTVLDNIDEHSFPPEVTHVLNGGGRTTKVMCALLRKVPVVQLEWIDNCIAADKLLPVEPFLRRRSTVADPLLNKTVCLTTSFLTSQTDIKAGYVTMAHQLCVAGKVRAVIEGDAVGNVPKIDFAIIGEADATAQTHPPHMTFRQFVRLIDQA